LADTDLITFLGKNRKDTPPELTVPGYEQFDEPGEAGRWLEFRLFDGTLEYSKGDQSSGNVVRAKHSVVEEQRR
jgi:hypothetical protein